MTDFSLAAVDYAIANQSKATTGGAEIAAALSAAQGEMTEPAFDGKGYHKNKYASLASVYKVTRPILAKHGLAVVHNIEGEQLVTTLHHSSGQTIVQRYPLHFAPIKEKDTPHMERQKTITYATRNSLYMLLGLRGDEDEGEGEFFELPIEQPKSNGSMISTTPDEF